MPIRKTVREFKQDLRKFSEKVDRDYAWLMKFASSSLFARIVFRTPVDEGEAVGNWEVRFTSVGGGLAIAFELGGGSSSGEAPGGQAGTENAIAQGLAAIETITSVNAKKRSVIIINRTPYIRLLEFGGYPGDGPRTIGGYSTQAPKGMVRISLAELRTELRTLRYVIH